jgi:hypothetical protein
MDVSTNIKGGPKAHNSAPKIKKKEQTESVPAANPSVNQTEKIELRESVRENSQKQTENASHINALQEAYAADDPTASSGKIDKRNSKIGSGNDSGQKKSVGDQDGDSQGENGAAKAPTHDKPKVKGNGHAKGKGKAKGHTKSAKGKAKGHAHAKPKKSDDDQDGNSQGKQDAAAKPGNSRAKDKAEDALDKLKDGKGDANDQARDALGRLKDGKGDAKEKVGDAVDRLKDSNRDTGDKVDDAKSKLKDLNAKDLGQGDNRQGDKKSTEPKPQEKAKEVVRTEARVHTSRSVESRQEAVQKEQTSAGKNEVVLQRTRTIRQADSIAPHTPPPKIERPRIEERERKPDQTDTNKSEKLRDRKPLKLSARPEENKTENLPLATRGKTQSRVQIAPGSSEVAIDRELDSQKKVGQDNTRAWERSESMKPKTIDRGEKIEKAKTTTRSDSEKKADELRKGQNQFAEDQKSALRAEEHQQDAKKNVLDSTRRVDDGENQIMTRERQIQEAGSAVSDAKSESLDSADMVKKADLRLDDALSRFHDGKLKKNNGNGKSKEEQDAVLRQAVTSAQEFQEKAQARARGAKQAEEDAKKGVTVASDRLVQDQTDLQKSKTHLEAHRENQVVTQTDFETSRKNVETGQTGVEDRRNLLSKLKLRQNGLGRESEHNEVVLRHLRESSEPLQENIRNQKENVERLQAQKSVPGQPRTVELKEMRELKTPPSGSAGNGRLPEAEQEQA